jgi:hypothetical protein
VLLNAAWCHVSPRHHANPHGVLALHFYYFTLKTGPVGVEFFGELDAKLQGIPRFGDVQTILRSILQHVTLLLYEQNGAKCNSVCGAK